MQRILPLNIHLHSIIRHHLLQDIINSVLSPWWQVRLNVINITAERMPILYSIFCSQKSVNHRWIVLILTYAYGDVCRPLIVVLAGDCFLSNQLEAKLALKPEDTSVWKAIPFSYSIERSSRVTTTLFVYFCEDTVSKGDIKICVDLRDQANCPVLICSVSLSVPLGLAFSRSLNVSWIFPSVRFSAHPPPASYFPLFPTQSSSTQTDFHLKSDLTSFSTFRHLEEFF